MRLRSGAEPNARLRTRAVAGTWGEQTSGKLPTPRPQAEQVPNPVLVVDANRRLIVATRKARFEKLKASPLFKAANCNSCGFASAAAKFLAPRFCRLNAGGWSSSGPAPCNMIGA